MIQSIIVITIVVIVLLRLYGRDYISAVCFGLFILVAAPENIAIVITQEFPVITIHRVVLMLMLLKCAGKNAITYRIGKATFWRVMLLIAGCYFISTILSPFFIVSFKRYLYFLIETLGCFWIVFTSLQDREDASRLLRSVGLAFSLVSVIAIFERYVGFEIVDYFPNPRETDSARFFWATGANTDITSTYAHRILLGLACAMGALKHLLDLAQSSNWRNQRWQLAQAVLCLAALYFSVSRGPWLAFLLGWVLMAAIVGRRAIKWSVLIGVLTLLLFLIRPGVWATISDLFSSTLDPETVKGSSFDWRFIVIKTALNEINRAGIINSLFGYGGGSQIMGDFGTAEIYPGIWLPIRSWDCEYAILLYERGIVGLALYLFLGVFALVRIAKKIKIDKITASVPVLTYCFVGLAVLLFAKTNVDVYAPQLVYVETSILAISSRYLSERHG
jgi:hypothetical protein